MNNYITHICLNELDKSHCFVSEEHRRLFSDLMNCYTSYPFFHKGLCKCMYLSCWDMEHYALMLNILNDMTIGRSGNTDEMYDNGISLENQAEGYDRYIFQLSGALLNDEEFTLPEEPIAEEGMRIIRQALYASEIIDRSFELYEDIYG